MGTFMCLSVSELVPSEPMGIHGKNYISAYTTSSHLLGSSSDVIFSLNFSKLRESQFLLSYLPLLKGYWYYLLICVSFTGLP